MSQYQILTIADSIIPIQYDYAESISFGVQVFVAVLNRVLWMNEIVADKDLSIDKVARLLNRMKDNLRRVRQCNQSKTISSTTKTLFFVEVSE